MRLTILFLTLLLLTGCQTKPESGVSATSSPHAEHSEQAHSGEGHEDHDSSEDSHSDHDDHAPSEDGHEDHDKHSEQEGFLELTSAQREQLKVTTQPVVAAGGQSTGLRPGRIEADPDRRVLISSQVQGTLQNIYVQVGVTIDAGASVAVIASPEVTSLQTEYHEAEVEAELARKELANKTELFRVSDEIYQPLETAKLEVAQAKAQRDAAAAQLQSTVLKNERLETLLRDGIASKQQVEESRACLLYTSPSPRDRTRSRMPSSA